MAIGPKLTKAANDVSERTAPVSPISKELVIGLVGYAGAGCSKAGERLQLLLHEAGYSAKSIKMSSLIADALTSLPVPVIEEGAKKGSTRLARAQALQDVGDRIRKDHGDHAVAALAVRKIIQERGSKLQPGEKRIAFIVDSIKHSAEVQLLREVYDTSFRLIAVHCDRSQREKRLIGKLPSSAKYNGAPANDVLAYMDRDERDSAHDYGQQVRDAFYLADFFLDNNGDSQGGENLNIDLQRFIDLVLGSRLVRPTGSERAMYHAHAAALQSSCLSRQVGASLVTTDGTVAATGTNDVPKFGGGVYDEDSKPDNRCAAWEWKDGDFKYVGCHNDRKKQELQRRIGGWLAAELAPQLALVVYPKDTGIDVAKRAREEAAGRIQEFFQQNSQLLKRLPGVKDLIEYSRSIHAEMNALLSAARNGVSTVGATLYCTTYPCHNCARHLVTAGVGRVYYIEPYVKSLAIELHSDAITTEMPTADSLAPAAKMVITPFTGVGPRMYEDFFTKSGNLKASDGALVEPKGDAPFFAVRLRDLGRVEETASKLLPEKFDA